ncbi:hypothetical protein ACFTY7_39170 [Streptomyces sp. NPDC057062]|uniref:hypothetical protein n=1 Tax=Streptomyces sp. NPDC057062 TaxID=3346011 RepID=UPI00362A7722
MRTSWPLWTNARSASRPEPCARAVVHPCAPTPRHRAAPRCRQARRCSGGEAQVRPSPICRRPPRAGPEACPPLTLPSDPGAFAAHLEIRPASEARPLGGGPRAELLAWLRFTDRRPLDAGTPVVLADALPPGLFAVWTVPRPVPTAELTVHFTDALEAAPVEDRVLVRIRTEYAGSGWAVEGSALWSTTGRLLALARQARALRNGPRPHTAATDRPRRSLFRGDAAGRRRVVTVRPARGPCSP